MNRTQPEMQQPSQFINNVRHFINITYIYMMSKRISTTRDVFVVDWRLRIVTIFICSIAALIALSTVGAILFYIVYFRDQL